MKIISFINYMAAVIFFVCYSYQLLYIAGSILQEKQAN
jgi:hypothetical protein